MMPQISYRVPPELWAAAEQQAAAANMSIGEFARKALEEKTGVTVTVKMGIGGTDERTRRRVERARIAGIKKAAAVRTEAEPASEPPPKKPRRKGKATNG